MQYVRHSPSIPAANVGPPDPSVVPLHRLKEFSALWTKQIPSVVMRCRGYEGFANNSQFPVALACILGFRQSSVPVLIYCERHPTTPSLCRPSAPTRKGRNNISPAMLRWGKIDRSIYHLGKLEPYNLDTGEVSRATSDLLSDSLFRQPSFKQGAMAP